MMWKRWAIGFLALLVWVYPLQAVHVLVSIAPQQFLVERIGGEWVTSEVLVPPGMSAHTYEPLPQQMLSIQQGQIWFRLGESFETRLLATLSSDLWVVDQRTPIDLICAGCGCHATEEAYDPHIWLSPRLLKSEAAQIADVLSNYDPDHAPIFAERLVCFQSECDALDQECRNKLSGPLSRRAVVVSHPAFGYFCRDYALEQLSIEMEGREPTFKYLQALLKKARAQKIKRVFLQKQYSTRGGYRIAKELGAETVYLDPYNKEVFETIRLIATQFAEACV